MKLNPAPCLLPTILFLTSCGGSGTGSLPTSPSQTLTFTSSSVATENTISLRQVPGALRDGVGPGRVLSLEVVATQVNNLGSVRFEIGFPGELFAGDRVILGPHLAQGGAIVEDGGLVGANFIRLSLERSGDTGASGTGVLATLDLLPRADASGSGNVTFFNADARNPAGRVKSNVAWISGTVQLIQ